MRTQIILITGGLALGGILVAETDPAQLYLSYWWEMNKANELDARGNHDATKAGKVAAKAILETLAKNHPEWKPETVTAQLQAFNPPKPPPATPVPEVVAPPAKKPESAPAPAVPKKREDPKPPEVKTKATPASPATPMPIPSEAEKPQPDGPTLVETVFSGTGLEDALKKRKPDEATNSPLPPELLEKLPEKLRSGCRTETGITPLMVAALLNRSDDINQLLKAGASKGKTTRKEKRNALQFACLAQNHAAAQILLGHTEAAEYRIKIDLASQTLRVFHKNVVQLAAPISSGKRSSPTRTGEFVITEKYGPVKISTLYPDANMPYFMRLGVSAAGIHAGELPGYPASHGCIRVPHNIARQMSKTVPLGTLVEIEKVEEEPEAIATGERKTKRIKPKT